jgi:hypothetical protein
MLIDLDMVRLGVQEKVEIVRTHPESISCVQEVIFTGCTYDSYFATELVLDLTSLDSTRRMFLYELEEVLDTHDGCACHSIARALLGCFLSLRAEECGCRQQLEAGEGSDDRTDDVTSKTRAGITRSHGSCPSRPKCTPHFIVRGEHSNTKRSRKTMFNELAGPYLL